MWCLWCYLHFWEHWVLQNFVHNIITLLTFLFPALRAERGTACSKCFGAVLQNFLIHFIWFSSTQGAQWVSVQAPGGFQALVWLGHPGEVTGPSWCHGSDRAGTESPSPCPGAQISLWKHFLAPAVSVVRNPPSTPWLLCRWSQAELWGIVPFPVGISGELVLALAGVPTLRDT